MSISEKANDLLNKFCGAQYDYVVWSTQDNLVARDKARQEISDYIAELEADNAEFRQLIRDWSIVLDQNDEFQLWQVESVRQAMLEINKEREE